MAEFARLGYAAFPPDAEALRWVEAARTYVGRSGVPAAGWRHGGTWFPGVDALDNAADGSVDGVALDGAAARAATRLAPGLPWHRAQISILRPGYPGVDPGERAGAVRFRRTRDAAHVDGLLPGAAPGERRLCEPHAFVLGLALSDAGEGASPLVVWPGSHRILGPALARALAPHSPDQWPDTDIGSAYAAARQEAFARCARVAVPLPLGGAVLLHRHLLHGVAPWADGATAPPEGRAKAYFRPCLARIADWL